jgi:hypothetical protein
MSGQSVIAKFAGVNACDFSPVVISDWLWTSIDRIDADHQSTHHDHDARQSSVTMALRHQRENKQGDCPENRADDLMLAWSPDKSLEIEECLSPRTTKS